MHCSKDVSYPLKPRLGAKVLVESTVVEGCGEDTIYFADSDITGHAAMKDIDLGDIINSTPEGTLANVPYKYSLLGSNSTKASVTANAGAILSFSAYCNEERCCGEL
ncbi:hypothetical protein RRF57_005103 [Xylaria bambusicola]|uniref:Uncharacterized protein n=1 Tax=Xylaria bambusicola TaxID=326684 RepID=A0AAN7ULD0_9PEZI